MCLLINDSSYVLSSISSGDCSGRLWRLVLLIFHIRSLVKHSRSLIKLGTVQPPSEHGQFWRLPCSFHLNLWKASSSNLTSFYNVAFGKKGCKRFLSIFCPDSPRDRHAKFSIPFSELLDINNSSCNKKWRLFLWPMYPTGWQPSDLGIICISLFSKLLLPAKSFRQ